MRSNENHATVSHAVPDDPVTTERMSDETVAAADTIGVRMPDPKIPESRLFVLSSKRRFVPV